MAVFSVTLGATVRTSAPTVAPALVLRGFTSPRAPPMLSRRHSPSTSGGRGIVLLAPLERGVLYITTVCHEAVFFVINIVLREWS